MKETLLPIYGGLIAAFAFFISSCTPEVENVFGETASHRVAQQQSDYYAILESQPQGWALDFYPSDRIEGGVVYTACFKDGKVTMACEQDINNTDISKRFTKGTEITSAFQIVSETSCSLSTPTTRCSTTGRNRSKAMPRATRATTSSRLSRPRPTLWYFAASATATCSACIPCSRLLPTT